MAASFQAFRSLVENSPDAISLIDEQGEILYGSSSNIKLSGYQPEELVGRNCLELIHPEDRPYASQALQEVLTKPPGPLKWNARVLRKDGNYSWVESTVSNLLPELEVQAIVMHQRDINDKREAEEKGRRHTEELTRSNLRLEEFAYTAAHDLLEPLRAISAFTELLVKRVEMDAEAREMAQFIVDGAARMAVLVNDLLTFARTGIQEPPRCFDLRHALSQALQNLAPDIEASRAAVTITPLPGVRSNEIHLTRLFQNLVGNALKYRSERPLEVHVSAEQRGSDWVVKVRDNGIGIPAEHQARVFMPFIRLRNRDVPGTGLGLAVCQKIVEGLGGTIWVESEVGVGSTFAFTITAGDGVSIEAPPQ